MITTAAMLPLYRKLRMRLLILACITMISSGVMNITPWGGPTARAASALSLDSTELFLPMIPAMVVAALFVVFVAYRLGMQERKRLASEDLIPVPDEVAADETPGDPDYRLDDAHRRPTRMLVNGVLTAALMGALITGLLPLPILFMIGFAVALMINYPSIGEQKALLSRHAGNAMAVAGLIFAAGIFTGILSGTGMVDAMANSVIRFVPEPLGPYLAIVTGLLSIPFTFFISNDAFYFGVLPILARAGEVYGISAAEMGRASLIGQPVHLLSPLVPSTYLLVGLVGVDFDAHQRFTLKWAFLTSLVLLAVGLATAVIPAVGRVIAPYQP
jgi:CitMHS family citrate-Mg2+:H+ or citrate-Ca2+:H+ symporter